MVVRLLSAYVEIEEHCRLNFGAVVGHLIFTIKNSRRRGTFLIDLTLIWVSGSKCRRQPPFAEGLEDAMSRESISIIVTIVVIALMFAWVPLVNFVCPPGWSSAEKPSSEEKEREKRKQGQSLQREPSAESTLQKAAPVSRLSSRRLRDQSRDLCEAISARGERGAARSQSTSYISSVQQ
jgi:hypothetical protein